jgi:glutamate synthase (NADPH/NADH) small chain
MAAAQQLARVGHEVHVFEREPKAGGLLRYGIPDFKMEKRHIDRRVTQMEGEGVRFHYGVNVGVNKPIDELTSEFDAVLFAGGAEDPRNPQLPGQELAGVHYAMPFLVQSNRRVNAEPMPGNGELPILAAGKNVVVIGGGDTAMDCVRTAVRQGAGSVKCLYRRDRANMPGSQREVANAEEEGVEFVWLSAPEAFVASDGRVTGVQASAMRLGPADASGRRAPEIDPGAGFALDADLVIKALGFDAEDLPTMFGAPELGVTRWGTLRVDGKTMMTSLDGVFAAGDIVRGASLVVWAIRDGRDVSTAMHKWLKAKAAATKVAA